MEWPKTVLVDGVVFVKKYATRGRPTSGQRPLEYGAENGQVMTPEAAVGGDRDAELEGMFLVAR